MKNSCKCKAVCPPSREAFNARPVDYSKGGDPNKKLRESMPVGRLGRMGR